MSRRIQRVNYYQKNIQGSRKNYSLSVHVEMNLKKRLRNLKVAIRRNVQVAKKLGLLDKFFRCLAT